MIPSASSSPSPATDPTELRRLVVDRAGEGERLDRWLSERTELSRTRVQRLLEDGRVLLNGAPARKSEALQSGDVVEMRVPAPESPSADPEEIPLEIVYQDGHLAVVNKPAGMVVHPSAGHPQGTLVNALLYHIRDLSGIGGVLRPGIVHRLDRDTSGLLVVAKDDATHRALSAALRRRRVKRFYLAAVWGRLTREELRIEAPIGRDPRERRRMAVVQGGRPAVTHARLREQWRAAQLLDVALETGRTHQIRVHLAHVGHPVVGDPVYGAGWERGMSGEARGWARELASRLDRQFLHAHRLAFRHPASGEIVRFEAPLPAELDATLRWARGREVG